MSGGDTAPVALVTGAAGGIGSAVCRRFLAGGWRVAAVDVQPVELNAIDEQPVALATTSR